jgi:uncharacterized protein YjcR
VNRGARIMRSWARVCAVMAARNCYDSGVSVRDIAAQAKVSPTTIRYWLSLTPGGRS